MDNSNKVSFELHSLLRDLKRNIWAIVLAGLIALMGTYVVSHSVYTPTYTSSATLVVRAKVGTSGAYTNLSVSAEMAKIFTEVFKQPSMGSLAAAHLGEESFDGRISASVIEETNLLKLSVTADEPELAFRLLCAILEIYPNISSAVFSNVVIDVMLSPEIPAAPSNTISSANQALFVLLAVIFQCGLITIISVLRKTVKSEKIFVNQIDTKLLGTIAHELPHLSFKEKLLRKKRALLISDGYSSLKFSEDYQKIATKLEHIKKMSQNKIFAITSVNENEGKSTAAANMAIALAGRGYRVALLDLDTRKPSVFKIFERRRMQTPELVSLFRTSPVITPDFWETFRYKSSNLYLFTNAKSRKTNPEWINSKLVGEWIREIAKEMDFVLIDTAPLVVSADAISLSDTSAQTILVVRTDRSAIEDINDTAITINTNGGVLVGCILNDVYKSFTFFNHVGVDVDGYRKYHYGSGARQDTYEQKVGKTTGHFTKQ